MVFFYPLLSSPHLVYLNVSISCSETVNTELDAGSVCLQFLLIFRKAAAGELRNDGLLEVYRHIREVDVTAEGVKGAKNFFEAKVPGHCCVSRFELIVSIICTQLNLGRLAPCG